MQNFFHIIMKIILCRKLGLSQPKTSTKDQRNSSTELCFLFNANEVISSEANDCTTDVWRSYNKLSISVTLNQNSLYIALHSLKNERFKYETFFLYYVFYCALGFLKPNITEMNSKTLISSLYFNLNLNMWHNMYNYRNGNQRMHRLCFSSISFPPLWICLLYGTT